LGAKENIRFGVIYS